MRSLVLCAAVVLLQGCAYEVEWRPRDTWSDGHGTIEYSYFTTPLIEPEEILGNAWYVADNQCERAGFDTAYYLSPERKVCGKSTLSGCAIMFVHRDFRCKNVEHRSYPE